MRARRLRFRALLVSVLFGVVVATSAAHAADVTRYQSRGVSASGGWSSTDVCVSTYASVYVADATSKVGGPPTETTNLMVSISQYNFCTNTTLYNIWGATSLSPNQFTGSKQLGGAALLASVTGYDEVTSSYVPLSISINWVGEGDIFRGMYQSHNWVGGGIFMDSRGSGSFRSATVSGSIFAGVTNYAAGSPWGQLAYTSNSFMTVTK